MSLQTFFLRILCGVKQLNKNVKFEPEGRRPTFCPEEGRSMFCPHNHTMRSDVGEDRQLPKYLAL